jgi:hypothetical protein
VHGVHPVVCDSNFECVYALAIVEGTSRIDLQGNSWSACMRDTRVSVQSYAIGATYKGDRALSYRYWYSSSVLMWLTQELVTVMLAPICAQRRRNSFCDEIKQS